MKSSPPPEDDGPSTAPLTPDGALVVPESLRLVVVGGPDAGRELVIRSGTYFVGQGGGCDLALRDSAVSRRHLEIIVTGSGVELRDLGSKNGTYYRGARVDRVTVGAGAVVRIGESELRFHAERRPPPIASRVDRFGALLGRSLVMRELFALLEQIAGSDAPVLIDGETGTGKELCAEAIVAASARKDGPFVVCDLGAVAPTLIESELYGHVRGAFTGADRDRDGAFALAAGGTLFLDEIGELRVESQPLLLRALERHQVKPLGGDEYQKVDVRVIAATRRNLAIEAQEGRFRSDLYYRLSVVHVRMPPLRERKEDIPLLLEQELRERSEVSVSDEAMALFIDHDWPGNVRELKNVVRRALSLLGAERVILPRHLGIADDKVTPARFHEAKQQLVDEWEIDYLRRLLERTGGNMARAARIAGVERAYLYKLVGKHGLRQGDGE